MSIILASQQILRRRRASGPGNTAAITTVPTGSLRSDFSPYVGFKFTPSANLYVKSLGRWKVSGNNQTHTVKLATAASVDIPNGSVSVDLTTGSNNAFVYTRLPAPILLSSGTTYIVASSETIGGDQWYDAQIVVSSADVTINNAVYYSGGFNDIFFGSYAYVPPGFLYDLTP